MDSIHLEQLEIPCLSLRNPWAFLIVEQVKRIKNQDTPLSPDLVNKWIAVKVLPTFDDSDKISLKRCVRYDPGLANKNEEQLNIIMTGQRGKIVGFIKFNQPYISLIDAFDIDAFHTNFPNKGNYQWHITDVIRLKDNEYIKYIDINNNNVDTNSVDDENKVTMITDDNIWQQAMRILNLKTLERQLKATQQMEYDLFSPNNLYANTTIGSEGYTDNGGTLNFNNDASEQKWQCSDGTNGQTTTTTKTKTTMGNDSETRCFCNDDINPQEMKNKSKDNKEKENNKDKEKEKEKDDGVSNSRLCDDADKLLSSIVLEIDDSEDKEDKESKESEKSAKIEKMAKVIDFIDILSDSDEAEQVDDEDEEEEEDSDVVFSHCLNSKEKIKNKREYSQDSLIALDISSDSESSDYLELVTPLVDRVFKQENGVKKQRKKNGNEKRKNKDKEKEKEKEKAMESNLVAKNVKNSDSAIVIPPLPGTGGDSFNDNSCNNGNDNNKDNVINGNLNIMHNENKYDNDDYNVPQEMENLNNIAEGINKIENKHSDIKLRKRWSECFDFTQMSDTESGNDTEKENLIPNVLSGKRKSIDNLFSPSKKRRRLSPNNNNNLDMSNINNKENKNEIKNGENDPSDNGFQEIKDSTWDLGEYLQSCVNNWENDNNDSNGSNSNSNSNETTTDSGTTKGEEDEEEEEEDGTNAEDNTNNISQMFNYGLRQMDTEPIRKVKGLAVDLLPHQQIGVGWMVDMEDKADDYRRKQFWRGCICNGGIMADEMGVGKTVQTIGLILYQKKQWLKNELLNKNDNEIQSILDRNKNKSFANRDEFWDSDDSDDMSNFIVDDNVDPYENYNENNRNKSNNKQNKSKNMNANSSNSNNNDNNLNRNSFEESDDDDNDMVRPLQKSNDMYDMNAESNNNKVKLKKKHLKFPKNATHRSRTVIVVPLAILDQWENELLNKAPNMFQVSVYYGCKRHSLTKMELKKYDVIITTFGSVTSDYANGNDFTQRGLFKLGGKFFDRIIIDEGHTIRNYKSNRFKAVAALAHKCQYRWCLTGTPIQNGLYDLFSLVHIVNAPNCREFDDFRRYLRISGKHGTIMYDNTDARLRLARFLSKVMIRRTKKEILPNLVACKQSVIEVEFMKEEKYIYNQFEWRAQSKYQEFEDKKIVSNNMIAVLLMLLRLRQICSHAYLALIARKKEMLKRRKRLYFNKYNQNKDSSNASNKSQNHNGNNIGLPSYLRDEYVSSDDDEKCNGNINNNNNNNNNINNNSNGNSNNNKNSNDINNDPLIGVSRYVINRINGLSTLLGAECQICQDIHDNGVLFRECGHIVCKMHIVNAKDQLKRQARYQEPNYYKKRVRCHTCLAPDCNAKVNLKRVISVEKVAQSKLIAPKHSIFSGLTDNPELIELFDIGALKKLLGIESTEEDILQLVENDHKRETTKSMTFRSNTGVNTAKTNDNTTNNTTNNDNNNSNNNTNDTSKGEEYDLRTLQTMISDPKFFPQSTKMCHLMDRLDSILTKEDPGCKILIFSQFTSMLDLVEIVFDKNDTFVFGQDYLRYDGSMNYIERKDTLAEFKQSKNISMLLLSLKCAGVGLNLIEANHVIFLDLWWNPGVESQAIDRCHRIGQTKTVYVERITIMDSIEQRILEIQKEKQKIADNSLDTQGSNPGSRLRGLSRRDIRRLLGIPDNARPVNQRQRQLQRQQQNQ